MPDDDFYQPEFPPEVEAQIQTIMAQTNATRDAVINLVMRAFFEMVDDPDKKNVPELVVKLRQARRKEKPDQAR